MTDKQQYDYKVSAAGRVNIIGEHVDYCGGKVLPVALSLNNTVYVRANGTETINIKWSTTSEQVSLDIRNLDGYRNLKYGNYIAGCALEWVKAGHKLVGCDMYQDCTVPFGSGLSSSAAIEVSTLAALAACAGETCNPVEIALLAQKCEHNYIGVRCGIMDQFVSACGEHDKAILLDCNSLQYQYLPLQLGEYSLVVADCNKPHSLVESKYNERREQTEMALALLQPRLKVNSLAEVTVAEFQQNADVLPTLLRQRAAHVVYECDRVRLAVEALQSGDIPALGRLLDESHASLRDLYEVTGTEPDALVAAAQSHPACIGSRLTGGGFGGCTISIVRSDSVDDFKAAVYANYLKAVGLKAKFYDVNISNGLQIEKL